MYAPKIYNNIDENKLMPSATNKIALFIDGANLYATAKTLGFDIDYKRGYSLNSRVVALWFARSTTPRLSKIRSIRRSGL